MKYLRNGKLSKTNSIRELVEIFTCVKTRQKCKIWLCGYNCIDALNEVKCSPTIGAFEE